MGGGNYFQLPMNGEKSFLLVQIKINQQCRSFLVTRKHQQCGLFSIAHGLCKSRLDCHGSWNFFCHLEINNNSSSMVWIVFNCP